MKLGYNSKQHETLDYSIVSGNFRWSDADEQAAQNLKAEWAEAVGKTEKADRQSRAGMLEKLRRHGLNSYYADKIRADIAARRVKNFLGWARENGLEHRRGEWRE